MAFLGNIFLGFVSSSFFHCFDRCTDFTKFQFMQPNSKYAWFQINFSNNKIPRFRKITIFQQPRKSANQELCCNVPDIYIEFSNDTKTWTTFEASLNDGQTIINVETLNKVSNIRAYRNFENKIVCFVF